MNTLTETVVPTWIAAILGAATLCLILAVVLVGLRAKKGAKAVDRDAKDIKALRRLFIAAVVPSLGVIGAVMAISFVGLAGFAHDDMGWTSWIAFIVPLSLDGISITFGFWAFVAVKRGRDPRRSKRIVYAGAIVSAWINFNHGRQEWTGAAGIYLGFLSLASAWLFHELLEQFGDGQDYKPKAQRNGVPVFGERWLWAPLSTFGARRAWIIFPPAPEVIATAANALAHHEAVKEAKRAQKAGKQAGGTSAVIAPVLNAGQPSAPATAAFEAATAKPQQLASFNGRRQQPLIGEVTR